MDYEFEISREIPNGLPTRYLNGKIPSFTVFECVAADRETSSGFATEAINVNDGRTRILRYSKYPIDVSEVIKIAERIWGSGIAGARRLEVDRPFDMRFSIEKCTNALNAVLDDITLNQEFELHHEAAKHILDTLYKHCSTLIENDAGTDVTLLYLLVGGIIKRSRINDLWSRGFYPGLSYTDYKNLPIAIATPSIAAGEAIINDYLPKLNAVLMELGVVKQKLKARLHKGRDNFICHKRLEAAIKNEQVASIREYLLEILENGIIDIGDTAGLDYRTKKRINVFGKCDAHSCSKYDCCCYMNMMKMSQIEEYDFILCSHRYYISDVQRRKNGLRPLIANYQSLVVVEPFKFLQTARAAYGTTLTNVEIPKLAERIRKLSFNKSELKAKVMPYIELLIDKNIRLFKGLRKGVTASGDSEDIIERRMVNIDNDTARHIRKIKEATTELLRLLNVKSINTNDAPVKPESRIQLRQVIEGLDSLMRTINDISAISKNTYWCKSNGDTQELRSTPKDLNARLYADQWNKRIPTIFVSNSLSTDGDFTNIKRNLGLEPLGNRVTEFRIPTPNTK